MRLDELDLGVPARVVDVAVADGLSLRLMEMGLTPGAAVEVLKVAPFGDPIELRVRGYRLSIRKQEAARFLVEPR